MRRKTGADIPPQTGSSGLAAQRTAVAHSSSSSSECESTTLAIPAPTRSSASNTPTPSPGVTTSQAVGIGVGSAALALLIAGSIGLFLWLRHRKKRPPRPPPKDDHHIRKWRGRGRSTVRGRIRGPFELDITEKDRMYELCGQGSPPAMVDHPLRSNPLTPYWSPPSSFGFQPAELETPLKSASSRSRLVELASPLKSASSRSKSVELASP